METDLVEIAQIQSELTRIWDSLEGTNKIRACLFNLILVTYKNERAEYIRTITEKVIERFPSRVIFITIDKEATKDYLDAKVSAMAGAKGESDVVCDLIELDAGGSAQVRIPFVILPQILPDLPIYVVWAENPCQDNPLAQQLEKLATRMIFDSESTDDLPNFAKALLKNQKAFGCDIADLNWARTQNWRELLSTVFYPQDRLLELQEAKTIQIVYNAYETKFFCHTKIQAIYLQGWLASQLNWKLESIGKDQFRYGVATVELVPAKNKDLPPGTVVSLEIETTRNDHFSFSRCKDNPQQINMIFSTPEKCDIPSRFLFTKSQSGLSLVNEICHNGTSEHYLKLLLFLSQIDSSKLC
jgi:glucose-6-phosphate dehydrogenase assembly protein OpcA